MTRAFPPGLDFEARPLPVFLERSAREHADATALIFLNRQLTYRQFKEDVDRFATALSALGVERGTRVAIQLPNLPQTVIAFYAVLSLGGVVVMTNPLYVAREIEHQWNDAGCTVAITADFLFAQRVAGIRSRLPVQHYVIASIPDYLCFPLNLLAPLKLRRAKPPLMASVHAGPDVHFMRRLIRTTPANPPRAAIDMDEPAALQYTGGTTGVAKGAVLTHRNLSCNVQQVAAWFVGARPGQEVMLGCLPFFHVFGLTVAMNFPVRVAGAIVLMPNPRDIHQMISNNRHPSRHLVSRCTRDVQRDHQRARPRQDRPDERDLLLLRGRAAAPRCTRAIRSADREQDRGRLRPDRDVTGDARQPAERPAQDRQHRRAGTEHRREGGQCRRPLDRGARHGKTSETEQWWMPGAPFS